MTTETTMVESSSGGRKGQKMERYDLVPPEAMRMVARHYGLGASKYSDHNWRKGYAWSLAFGAMMRHAWAFWGGEDTDQESGSPHMAAVAFHAMTLLTYMEMQRKFDDRPNAKEATK
jgi:hypothetical protein